MNPTEKSSTTSFYSLFQFQYTLLNKIYILTVNSNSYILNTENVKFR